MACRVCAVYTQPDRPAGRGHSLRTSPVKRLALELDLPLLQPHSLRDAATLATLSALEPELVVVAAYGMLLPASWLALPRHGCINVHSSLLPRWRGAAPVQRAIASGDSYTGITIMQMDSGLDTGDILRQRNCAIGADETAGELERRLAALGAEALVEVVCNLAEGSPLVPQAQDARLSCPAPKISVAEAWLDWTRPATELSCQVRAMNPVPGARLRTGEQQLKLWRAEALPEEATELPSGTVLGTADSRRIEIACGRGGRLRLLQLQLPGKRALDAADFLNGHAQLLRPGLQLDSGTP